MKSPDVKNEIKGRAGTIRARTWTLTLAIIVSIVLYFLVKIAFKDEMDVFGFIVTCVLQIVVHCLYFPEGELFGMKDQAFEENRRAYNDKANKITEEKKITRLRDYCEFEFEERKKRYLISACSGIGITQEEFEILKQKSEKEIKTLNRFEHKGKVLYFSRKRRKQLYRLIFNPLPVEENSSETIMSAVESTKQKAIHDDSVSYKSRSYIRKVLYAVAMGLILAYIGYSFREGIGFAQIVSIVIYVTTIFTSSVLAFSAGETCQKVHKSRYYLSLANFIDGFLEWDKRGDTDPITKKTTEETVV